MQASQSSIAVSPSKRMHISYNSPRSSYTYNHAYPSSPAGSTKSIPISTPPTKRTPAEIERECSEALAMQREWAMFNRIAGGIRSQEEQNAKEGVRRVDEDDLGDGWWGPRLIPERTDFILPHTTSISPQLVHRKYEEQDQGSNEPSDEGIFELDF